VRRWRGNQWLVLATLSLGFFLTLLDLTIVNIAIPAIRQDLHASLAGIGWVINAYIIVVAALVITTGRLGDLHGKRTLFVTGVVLFTLASVASGLARNTGELIATRAVQGLGAALLSPQTMAIIMVTFPAHRRGVALGVWGGVGGLATIAGPTIGGLLVSSLGWRWIFFVNLPVGLVATVLALLVIPEVGTGRRRRLDLPGVLLVSAALVAITYGLVEGQDYGWGTVWSFVTIPLILCVGVMLLAVFLVVETRRQDGDPLLPFPLFRDRNYSLMGVANVMLSVGMVGMALPLTLYLQSELDFSAVKAGLTMAPSSLVAVVVAPFAGHLADRGGKYLLMAGFVLFAAGLTQLAIAAAPAARWYDLLPGFLVIGLGVGLAMSPMQTIATRNIQSELAGAASGVLNALRPIGSALGSAVVLAILQNRLATHADYGAALRVAMLVPIGVLVIGALLCPAISGPARAPALPQPPAGAGRPVRSRPS